MAYINNGYERTLDINIIEYINGVIINKVVESGLGSFSYGNNTYYNITVINMQELSESDYETRMNDFCNYLQVKYNGLIISNRSTTGNNFYDNSPRRPNIGLCPIIIAVHDISLPAILTYSYGITSDTQNINMSSTDSWQINGLPSIVTVTPGSGDNTITSLSCTRIGWGNDTLTIQNLYNNNVASCIIQALYLTVDKNLISLSDQNNTGQIGISIAGGLDDYNIIKTGDIGYFTVTKEPFIPGNTITTTNITVTSITSSQNRSLTITLQHVTNIFLQQIITITYTPTTISVNSILYMGEGNVTSTTSLDACNSKSVTRGYYINPAQNAGLTTNNILYHDDACTIPETVYNPSAIGKYVALSVNGVGSWYVVQLGGDGHITSVNPC